MGFLERLEELARKLYDMNSSHDFDHVLRVVEWAKVMGEREGADMEVLLAAAYLHDVAREMERKDPNLDHALEGAKIAEKVLKELRMDEEKIRRVKRAIEEHRYKRGMRPSSKESAILQDADRLDALGGIGIYRLFMHSFETGRSVEDTLRHIEEKLLRLPDLMNTQTAKKIARDRVKVVEKLYESLKEDLKGRG